MCTDNGGLYLREQLDSIAAPTRLPDELVVCDDGPTDRTVAILNGFAASAPFPVRVHVNPANLGTPKNFEGAIGLTTGEFIALADQDDVWYPHKLERLEKELARSARIGLVYSDADVVDEQLRPAGYRLWEMLRALECDRRSIARRRPFEVLIRDTMVTGCTAAFRANYKDLVVPIFQEWGHDAWIAFLIAAVADVGGINEPLLAYRQHAANRSASRGPARKARHRPAAPETHRRNASESRGPGGAPAGGLRPPRSQSGPFSEQANSPPRSPRRHPARRKADRHSARDQLGAARARAVLGACHAPEGLRRCRKDVMVRT
jgi:Glycosyl transferase family 2